MTELRYTLVSDGPSDSVLQHHLTWLLQQHINVETAVAAEWADLRFVTPRPRSLAERIRCAIELYPCDLLFVHRDAEREKREKRVDEIAGGVASLATPRPISVCVVPVWMQEAWLLFDEYSIRQAAGNPRGRVPLVIPKANEVEQLPDPKAILYQLLKLASEQRGRRLRKFSVQRAAKRVADLIDDFAPLRQLSAFNALEKDLIQVLQSHDWTQRN